MNEQGLAKGLGYFSIGLGLAELLAPRQVSKVVGADGEHDELIRGYGLRELTSGVGILMHDRPSPGWLWSRVAGDALDLGTLFAALQNDRTDRRRIYGAIAAVAGVTLLDVFCASQLGSSQGSGQKGSRAGAGGNPNGYARQRRQAPPGHRITRKVITINRPAEELYSYWRNFENLPRFMRHLKSVKVTGDRTSRWVARGPMNTSVQWDAEITGEIPGEVISWRSLPGSTVDHQGTVKFFPATGGRGTVVRVDLQYRAPAGAVGATIAKLFGEAPEKQIPMDLLRFKQLIETGEIARTEGQPAGRPRSTSRKYDDFVRV